MRTLRFSIVLLAAIVVVSLLTHSRSTQDKVPARDADAIKQQIIELERRWQQAVVARDRSAIDSLLAKGFFEQERTKTKIEPGPTRFEITRRQEYLDRILKSDFDRYEIAGNITVNVETEASASAGFRLTVERAAKLVPLSTSEARRGGYDVVDSWVKTDGAWQVSSRQAVLPSSATIVPLKNQD
jgi:hypothetical protein